MKDDISEEGTDDPIMEETVDEAERIFGVSRVSETLVYNQSKEPTEYTVTVHRPDGRRYLEITASSECPADVNEALLAMLKTIPSEQEPEEPSNAEKPN